jgi:predicted metal-binding membrane protein
VASSLLAWLVLVTGSDMPLVDVGLQHRHFTDGVSALVHFSIRWLLMVVAMMLPLVVGSIRIVAQRSLWARRHRAIGGFLIGYVGVWAGAGFLAAVAVTGSEVHRSDDPRVMGAAVFAIAAWWQLTPAKLRALSACHRTMALAPRGWRADRDCIHYGVRIGAPCVVSCGPLMTACLLTGHGVPAMVCAGLVGAAERYAAQPNQRWISASILAFAAGQMGATLLP